MDIATVNLWLSASPFQALEKHRSHMLEALNLLSRHLYTTYLTDTSKHSGRPLWLTDLTWQIEYQEQQTITGLNWPFLRKYPKEAITHLIQIQSSISHLTFHIAERISYPTDNFPDIITNEITALCYCFDDACQALKNEINDKHNLINPRYTKRNQRKQALSQIYHQQNLFSKHISIISRKLHRMLSIEKNKNPIIDNMVLNLALDDICELMNRIRYFLSILLRY